MKQEIEMSTEQKLRAHKNVEFVDDERNLENGIIVTLMPDLEFLCDPGCGVRGFDGFADALREVESAVPRAQHGGQTAAATGK